MCAHGACVFAGTIAESECNCWVHCEQANWAAEAAPDGINPAVRPIKTTVVSKRVMTLFLCVPSANSPPEVATRGAGLPLRAPSWRTLIVGRRNCGRVQAALGYPECMPRRMRSRYLTAAALSAL